MLKAVEKILLDSPENVSNLTRLNQIYYSNKLIWCLFSAFRDVLSPSRNFNFTSQVLNDQSPEIPAPMNLLHFASISSVLPGVSSNRRNRLGLRYWKSSNPSLVLGQCVLKKSMSLAWCSFKSLADHYCESFRSWSASMLQVFLCS
jgi:hypothetical protein